MTSLNFFNGWGCMGYRLFAYNTHKTMEGGNQVCTGKARKNQKQKGSLSANRLEGRKRLSAARGARGRVCQRRRQAVHRIFRFAGKLCMALQGKSCYNNRRAVIIFYGQGDAPASRAPALMANYPIRALPSWYHNRKAVMIHYLYAPPAVMIFYFCAPPAAMGGYAGCALGFEAFMIPAEKLPFTGFYPPVLLTGRYFVLRR